MTRLPRATGKDIVRALQKVGFPVDSTRGSHVFLKHPDGRATAVPAHPGETPGPGILRSILRDAKLTADDLADLL
jgi:predicted RNA binding protein YcfA (HicA-like mRNA interferase family)